MTTMSTSGGSLLINLIDPQETCPKGQSTASCDAKLEDYITVAGAGEHSMNVSTHSVIHKFEITSSKTRPNQGNFKKTSERSDGQPIFSTLIVLRYVEYVYASILIIFLKLIYSFMRLAKVPFSRAALSLPSHASISLRNQS